MTNDQKTPQQIADTDLDAATGAGSDHKKWIEIQTISAPLRPSSSDNVPIEDFSMNFEEIKVT